MPDETGAGAGPSGEPRMPSRQPGAASPHQGTRMPPEGMIVPHSDPFSPELLQRVLNLSEQQVGQMRQLAVNYEKEMIRKQAEMEIARIDFVEELRQEKPDMAKIETLLKRMANLEAELGLFRIRKLQETAGFLTPEQHKKFREYSLAIVEQMRTMNGGRGEGYGSGMFGGAHFPG
jgi:Spy/CpxP family protein refolding chaperone